MSAKQKGSVHTSPEMDEPPEITEAWIEGADLYKGKRLESTAPRRRKTAV
jgi:hypothetical protein